MTRRKHPALVKHDACTRNIERLIRRATIIQKRIEALRNERERHFDDFLNDKTWTTEEFNARR